MTKKILVVLVLAAVVAGGVFAQKNTLTVDLGPTIVGAAFGAIGNVVSADDGVSSSGFGIGAQYELQPFQKLSFAARFAYLGFGYGVVEEDGGNKAKLDMGMSSFSIEGHVRYYPFSAGTFFVDGLVGYGRLMADLSGEILVDEGGHKYIEPISMSPSRNYMKLGAKLGWRFCFGNSGGGFTFEPSVGYNVAIGLGDTLGKQVNEALDDDIDYVDGIDDAFSLLEDYLFIGGPRVSLAIGWRF